MRLICPNCGAQYEVPEDVIPDGGRDVQCSNCGDTWFQKHPSQDQDLAEDLGQPLDESHWEDDETSPDPDAERQYESDHPDPRSQSQDDWAGFEDDDDGDLADGEDETPGQAPRQAPEAPKPRGLDPEVRDVLRQEADYEARARAEESAANGLETQPDLGLEEPSDDASKREREARLRMAQMRGQSEKEALGAAAAAELAANASRRDLLPDIEEINSTLRKNSDRKANAEAGDASAAVPSGKGFSRGFMMMILLIALAVALYAYADALGDAVPALKTVLAAYVGLIDLLRGWLDGAVRGLAGWLDGMSSEAAPS